MKITKCDTCKKYTRHEPGLYGMECTGCRREWVAKLDASIERDEHNRKFSAAFDEALRGGMSIIDAMEWAKLETAE